MTTKTTTTTTTMQQQHSWVVTQLNLIQYQVLITEKLVSIWAQEVCLIRILNSTEYNKLLPGITIAIIQCCTDIKQEAKIRARNCKGFSWLLRNLSTCVLCYHVVCLVLQWFRQMVPLLDLFAVFASLFETKLFNFQAFEYLLSFVLISYGINYQIICIKNNYQKTYYFMMQNI